MSPRAVLVALASILVAALLAGCGLEGQPFSTSTDKDKTASVELNPAVVTADAIGKYPPTSPQAAALEWWRGVQTRDPEAVIKSYSAKARDELPRRFPVALVSGLAPPAAQSSIRIAYVESKGDDEATVYVVIDSADPRMNGPLALAMEKVNDRWQITDPTFLGTLADTYILAQRAAEASTTGSGE